MRSWDPALVILALVWWVAGFLIHDLQIRDAAGAVTMGSVLLVPLGVFYRIFWREKISRASAVIFTFAMLLAALSHLTTLGEMLASV